jgi:hypothetical protein
VFVTVAIIMILVNLQEPESDVTVTVEHLADSTSGPSGLRAFRMPTQ